MCSIGIHDLCDGYGTTVIRNYGTTWKPIQYAIWFDTVEEMELAYKIITRFIDLTKWSPSELFIALQEAIT